MAKKPSNAEKIKVEKRIPDPIYTQIYVPYIEFNIGGESYHYSPDQKQRADNKPLSLSKTAKDSLEMRVKGLTIIEEKREPKVLRTAPTGKKKVKGYKEHAKTFDKKIAASAFYINIDEQYSQYFYNLERGKKEIRELIRKAEIDFQDSDFSDELVISDRLIRDTYKAFFAGKINADSCKRKIDDFIENRVRKKLDLLVEEKEKQEMRDAHKRAEEKARAERRVAESFNTSVYKDNIQKRIRSFDSVYTLKFLTDIYANDPEGFQLLVDILFSQHETHLPVQLMVGDFKIDKDTTEKRVFGIEFDGYELSNGDTPEFEYRLIANSLSQMAALHSTGKANFDPKTFIDDEETYKNYLDRVKALSISVGKSLGSRSHNNITRQAEENNRITERYGSIGSVSFENLIDTFFSNGENKRLLKKFADVLEIEDLIVYVDEDSKEFVLKIPSIGQETNQRIRDIIISTLVTLNGENQNAISIGKKKANLQPGKNNNPHDFEKLIEVSRDLYDGNSPKVRPAYVGFDFNDAVENTALTDSAKSLARTNLDRMVSKLQGGQGKLTVYLSDPRNEDAKPKRIDVTIPEFNNDGTITFRNHPVERDATQTPDKEQREFLNSMDVGDLIIGEGSAGTGKTHWSSYRALELLSKGQVNKIVVTAPAVDVGEAIGFLPGSPEEKMEPYVYQILQSMDFILGHGDETRGKPIRQGLVAMGKVEIMPSNYLRGYDAKNVCCLFDEFQNFSWTELATIVTRLGRNRSKFVLTGHLHQVDRPTQRDAAKIFLERLESQYERLNKLGLMIIRFSPRSVMRHPLVKAVQEDGLLKSPYGPK